MIPFDRADLLNILYQSEVKLTPRVFIKKIRSKLKVSSSDAKKIIKHLITEQELCYHQLYGSTYIEQSFLKPVRVTNHFILSPPGFKKSDKGRTLIIEPGISFGSGQHPTTKLCLEAIDLCLYKKKMIERPDDHLCADVGTGSGVLALALVTAGLGSCRGYEIDPVSVHEARKNVTANGLEQQVDIIEDYMPESCATYAVICANLRYPTLKSLSELITTGLVPGGVAILSGLRDWEKKDLIDCYTKKGMTPVWDRDEKHWSAVMLVKGAS